MQLIRPDTRIDFVQYTKVCAVLSVTALVIVLTAMVLRGFNWGIEFAGGTVIEVRIPPEAGDVDEGTLRDAVQGLGYEGAVVTSIGAPADRDYSISLKESQAEDRDLSVKVGKALNDTLGTPVEIRSVESIGPRVGSTFWPTRMSPKCPTMNFRWPAIA